VAAVLAVAAVIPAISTTKSRSEATAMCLACGDATAFAGQHGISLTERPAHRLCGVTWDGTHAEAEAGAIRDLIAQVKEWSDRRTALWKSPIVGISWNDRPDGFRTFVGIAPDPGETVPDGFSVLEFPEMRFAGSWHGQGDGDVVAHYGRMIEWLGAQGHVRDTSLLHHREEYPNDIDLSKPPSLRLLMPLAGR
jgi:predicted transcriptional regulator YdeE